MSAATADPTPDQPDQSIGGHQFIADLLTSHDQGIPIEAYLASRAAGATHAEVLQIVTASIDLVQYARALSAGATHAEVLAAANLDYNKRINGYARARQAGATHAEVFEAVSQPHLSAAHYARLLEAGVTHAEATDRSVVRSPLSYRRARRLGATHAEVDAVQQGSGSISDYIANREAGHAHPQAGSDAANS